MSILVPKIFISYSWAVADRVLELAEKLVNPGGVDVVLDKWELKEGQDKYVFMEQSVNNPEITHVLIICDKTYVQKANNREGGVGDETIIISSEIYGKVGQEKFIPIIFETDENGEVFLPAYIKSRIYIDLSNDDTYEEQYEKLLRNLHGKPEHRKPQLSCPPEWLNDDEDVSLSAIRALIKQIKGAKDLNTSKVSFIIRKAEDEFFQALKSFEMPLDKQPDGDLLLKKIDATKPLRDCFLDYIEALLSKDLPAGDIASDYFENLHNNIVNSINLNSWYPDNLELYHYFIWESFICTVAILLHYDKYGEINKMLERTYFLRDSQRREEARNSTVFNYRFKIIETICKPKCDNPDLFTLAGDMVIKREKRPFITRESLVNADLILYQLSCAFNVETRKWFPTLYCYNSRNRLQPIWTRLISKKHCKKIFPLFDINSITELKGLICRCINGGQCSYPHSFDTAPNILDCIKLEEIGTRD